MMPAAGLICCGRGAKLMQPPSRRITNIANDSNAVCSGEDVDLVLAVVAVIIVFIVIVGEGERYDGCTHDDSRNCPGPAAHGDPGGPDLSWVLTEHNEVRGRECFEPGVNLLRRETFRFERSGDPVGGELVARQRDVGLARREILLLRGF